MKETYIKPETNVITLEARCTLLAGSGYVQGISGVTEVDDGTTELY